MIGVYVLVDAAEDPLYVGASVDVARRVNEHRVRQSPFWPRVADVWVYPAESKRLALHDEKHKIHELRPRFNKYHRGFITCPCGCDRGVSA